MATSTCCQKQTNRSKSDSDDPFDDSRDGYYYQANSDGKDGSGITGSDVRGSQDQSTGIFALDSANLFNILYIPPLSRGVGDVDSSTLAMAAAYCQKRRALLIVDPPQGANSLDEGVAFYNHCRSSIAPR